MNKTILNEIAPKFAAKFEKIIYSDKKKYHRLIYDYENSKRGVRTERIMEIVSQSDTALNS